MRTKLKPLDRVRYKAPSGRKIRGTVVECLPFPGERLVPVLKRKTVVWMERRAVRKLPSRGTDCPCRFGSLGATQCKVHNPQ